MDSSFAPLRDPARKVLSTSDEAHLILQVMAASLVALTAMDAFMVVSVLLGPNSLSSWSIRFGELLFIPACLWVGCLARPLGSRRILPLAASFATAFSMLTQFRGAWTWTGTFDTYTISRVSWVRDGLIGIALAVIVGFIPAKTVQISLRSGAVLAALAASAVIEAVLPKALPLDSAFAANRYLGILAALITLAALAFFLRSES